MKWYSLGVSSIHELNIHTTLQSGQCFRWVYFNKMWMGVVQDQLITLKQDLNNVYYQSTPENQTKLFYLLKDYFQLDKNLKELYQEWNQDQNFLRKAKQFPGLRILRYLF